MLASVAFLSGGSFVCASLARAVKLPALLGSIGIGCLFVQIGVLDEGFLAGAPALRALAFTIILIRAGLSLDPQSLRSGGVLACLLGVFAPAAEMAGVLMYSTMILGWSVPTALMLGSAVSSLSPALVIPRMLELYEVKNVYRFLARLF